MSSLIKLAVFLLAIPFIAAFYLLRWILQAFRALWKSNLDLRLKWGITGGLAALVLVGVIVSSIQPTAPSASGSQTGVGGPASSPTDAVADASGSTRSATPSATSTPTPTPTPKPVAASVAPVVTIPPPTKAPAPQPPPPAFNYCGAPANPWHYNFCAGNVIYAVPPDFCGYFPCIPSFWKSTNGYAEECVDGMYSHSGGRSGACSYHDGELRALLGP